MFAYIVPLETLENSSLGLSHILLFAGYARNGINKVGMFVHEVPFTTICDACDHAGDFSTVVQVRTVPSLFGFAGILNEVGNVSNLSK